MPLYDMPLFRPPSEADSVILQVTLGCSHNRCDFCSMYRTKRFRAVSLEEIQRDLDVLRQEAVVAPRRVFLADGDAMCLSFQRLAEILDRVNDAFPRLQRIGIYANARDVAAKTDDQLVALRERKLKIAYVGLESGDDPTLQAANKGASVSEIVEAVKRLNAAGFRTSVMVLVGLAGRTRSQEHACASAAAINEMQPTFTSLLTYTPTEGSERYEDVREGRIELPNPRETLVEIRTFVEHVTCHTYFACNHASNYLPLTGTLPETRDVMLRALDAALEGRRSLKPEWLRGL